MSIEKLVLQINEGEKSDDLFKEIIMAKIASRLEEKKVEVMVNTFGKDDESDDKDDEKSKDGDDSDDKDDKDSDDKDDYKSDVGSGKKDTFKIKESTEINEAFTRQHFVKVAKLISEIPDQATRQKMADEHAKMFKADNPRFDHSRWHSACGTENK